MVLNADNLLFQQNRFWFSGNQGPFITGPSGPGQWAGVFYSNLCDGIPGSEAALEYESEPSWHADFNFQTIATERGGSRLRECRSAATESRSRGWRGRRPGASGAGWRSAEHGGASEKPGRHGRTSDMARSTRRLAGAAEAARRRPGTEVPHDNRDVAGNDCASSGAGDGHCSTGSAPPPQRALARRSRGRHS